MLTTVGVLWLEGMKLDDSVGAYWDAKLWEPGMYEVLGLSSELARPTDVGIDVASVKDAE